MTTDYRKSHLHPGKGKSYHASFFKNPYRNMVWKFEQSIIDSILRLFFKNEVTNHLDFACGTGRILSHISNRTKHSVGVDLSPSMLEEARKFNEHAEIIEGDLTENDVLENRKFDLITAFRFFPNAQPQLRKEVMGVLCAHLEDFGYIVFNNHRNVKSSLNRLYHIFGREKRQGMSNDEVKSLIAEFNLEIVKTYHTCVFPASENRTFLPIFLLRPLETLLSRLKFFQNYGANLIYVCRHAKVGN